MTKEHVLAKLKFDVELRGLNKYTQDEYLTKAKMFQNHFDKPATELGEHDLSLDLIVNSFLTNQILKLISQSYILPISKIYFS